MHQSPSPTQGVPFACPCGKTALLAPGEKKYVCPRCGKSVVVSESREAVKGRCGCPLGSVCKCGYSSADLSEIKARDEREAVKGQK